MYLFYLKTKEIYKMAKLSALANDNPRYFQVV